MRPVIVITHAAFAPERRQSLNRLTAQLRERAPDIQFLIAEDHVRAGSLWCWELAMSLGLSSGASHVVWLPDDAEVCEDFGEVLRACIEARPDDVWDGLVNHPVAPEVRTLWYSTNDGFVGLCGCFPRKLLAEHLTWRSKRKGVDASLVDDAGVNLWAMDTGRLIYKTAFSIVTHNASLPSLCGHDEQLREQVGLMPIDKSRVGLLEDKKNFVGRTYAAPEEHAPGYRSASTHLGRTYQSNHLELLELDPPNIQSYFDVERGHGLTGKPELFIAAPAYRGEVKSDWVIAVMREILYLKEAKVDVSLNFKSDSLINRARNRLLSDFLASSATHCLFWDTDNFPTKVGWAGELMASKHDLVGGAVVLKDGKGDKFNVRFGATGEFQLEVVNGCIPMTVVGTGFLMVTREAVMKMCLALHHTAYYRAGRWMDKPGRPEWALFADVVRNRDHLSEDYEFCERWRDLGGKVYLHPDIDFVHIGEQPYEGSFRKTFLTKGESDVHQEG